MWPRKVARKKALLQFLVFRVSRPASAWRHSLDSGGRAMKQKFRSFCESFFPADCAREGSPALKFVRYLFIPSKLKCLYASRLCRSPGAHFIPFPSVSKENEILAQENLFLQAQVKGLLVPASTNKCVNFEQIEDTSRMNRTVS